MDDPMKVLLLDVSNLCFRSYPRADDISRDLFKVIIKMAEDFEPQITVGVFDAGTVYRSQIYPEYKAHRGAGLSDSFFIFKDAVKREFEVIKEMFPHMNIKVAEFPGYEADDLIAAFSYLFKEDCVRIVSEDEDLLQLITSGCDVLQPMKKRLVTLKTIQEYYSLPPKEFLNAKIIIGDTSDNISGISGIGKKVALKIFKHVGTLDLELVFKNKTLTTINHVTPKIVEDLYNKKELLGRNMKLIDLKYAHQEFKVQDPDFEDKLFDVLYQETTVDKDKLDAYFQKYFLQDLRYYDFSVLKKDLP